MEAKRDCEYFGCKRESCTLYDKDDRTYSCADIRNRGECPIQEGR